MIFNKEYIEQLLKRFMDGETTEQEEQFLTEYFSKSDSIPEEWETYREMFASFATDAYDFTEEELSTFVKEEKPKPRNIKMWPWLAAACVAALMVIFLAPPREETQQMAKAEKTIVPQKEVKDSVMTSPISQPQKEEKQLAQMAERRAIAAKPGSSPMQKGRIAKPASANNDLAMADESTRKESAANDVSATIEDNLMAEQPPQFQEMENAFLLHSAPIRERGQQVIHRVSMLQKEQRNQQQYVEL